MKKIYTSESIYIDRSKIKKADRGVFANCDIKKDAIIEICPIVEVSKNDRSNLKDSLLVTYFLYFGKNKERLAIMLGFGSIYNHSYQPNAKFIILPKEKIINFVALSDIKKGEEITFNYRNDENINDRKTPLWFESVLKEN